MNRGKKNAHESVARPARFIDEKNGNCSSAKAQRYKYSKQLRWHVRDAVFLFLTITCSSSHRTSSSRYSPSSSSSIVAFKWFILRLVLRFADEPIDFDNELLDFIWFELSWMDSGDELGIVLASNLLIMESMLLNDRRFGVDFFIFGWGSDRNWHEWNSVSQFRFFSSSSDTHKYEQTLGLIQAVVMKIVLPKIELKISVYKKFLSTFAHLNKIHFASPRKKKMRRKHTLRMSVARRLFMNSHYLWHIRIVRIRTSRTHD